MIDATKIAVLREAVDRADAHAAVQAKLVEAQQALIDTLQLRIKRLESELSEARSVI